MTEDKARSPEPDCRHGCNGDCMVSGSDVCNFTCHAFDEGLQNSNPAGPQERTSLTCLICFAEIREKALKGGPCWVRVSSPGNTAHTICEQSPDCHHHPDLGPESGHTFRVSVESRGSYAVAGVEGHTDAEDFSGPVMTVEVRAWDLPEAVRRASNYPLSVWFAPELVQSPVRDERGCWMGYEPRECGEHRTTGEQRAWCYDCGEWCSESGPCVRCEVVALRKAANRG